MTYTAAIETAQSIANLNNCTTYVIQRLGRLEVVRRGDEALARPVTIIVKVVDP